MHIRSGLSNHFAKPHKTYIKSQRIYLYVPCHDLWPTATNFPVLVSILLKLVEIILINVLDSSAQLYIWSQNSSTTDEKWWHHFTPILGSRSFLMNHDVIDLDKVKTRLTPNFSLSSLTKSSNTFVFTSTWTIGKYFVMTHCHDLP